MDTAIRACISPDVHPSRITGILRNATARLSAAGDILDLISSNPATENTLAKAAQTQKQALENGEFVSLREFASQLTTLEQLAATDQPHTRAAVIECQALIAASMQNHQSAAELCRYGSEIADLEYAQKWCLLHLQAILLAEHGQLFEDDTSLQAAIELLKTTILPLAEESADSQNMARSHSTLGNVLGMIGQRRRGTRHLEEAIKAFEEALDQISPDIAPAMWAGVQNSLGNALGSLGQRSSDDNLLRQSIEAFEQALTRQSESSCASDWASTMNNLAAVQQSLGCSQNDAKVLKQSVESYKAVLRVWTRADMPLDWATTMDNLGTALRNLGEHRRGPGTLKQAVAAYRSALAERQRELVPDDWAKTQNNLGAALQKLAQREESSEIMQRATESYEQSLAEWTREKTPLTWAFTIANLGVARREVAQMTGDIETADKAVEEIGAAVDFFRGASHAQYTELGEEQLSKARMLLATLVAEKDSGAAGGNTSAVDDVNTA
ncbi:MAG: tetratricopeptide repeat protein [Acidiferrobacterales bacterium]|nr:tetratricopeptide repeat protein [Acidiferrobacterales bacterium]